MTFVRVGLIVTGEGEECFLPRFFRSIMARANTTFEVIRRSPQLNPITSPARKLKMVGSGRSIARVDEEQYGFPARRYLEQHPNSLVLVIDDLEFDRHPQAAEVFQRYRLALDTQLKPLGLSERAAVHFLVNMLEAYYFADAAAVTHVAPNVGLVDYNGDVETIRHPKNELKHHWPSFDEVADGERVVAALDLNHVLDNPQTCCWLRSLIGWCIEKLDGLGAVYDRGLLEAFQLPGGCREPLTRSQ